MIFANTKERILKYLEFKGIKVSQFFIETGIKRGFLDTDKLSAAVSDIHLATIIATYQDLNLEWLISENGDMIKQIEEDRHFAKEPEPEYRRRLIDELLQTKNDTISILTREVTDLRSDKDLLKTIIEKGLHQAS